MRLRNILMVLRGEMMLTALCCMRLFFAAPGLCAIYHAVLHGLVKRTRLFDEQYYLGNNPDIAESRTDALIHYVVHGDREGRSPMALFEPPFYRQSTNGWTRHVNALLHFTYVGRYRDTRPSPWFDVGYYLKSNKDVARAGIDPLIHYLEWGGMEGRSPCPHFDGSFYLKNNPDVHEAGVNPLLHYLHHGRAEGRRTVPAIYAGYPDATEDEAPSPVHPDDDEWRSLAGRVCNENAEVDVIVPVYKGESETLRCIHSVLSTTCRTPFELIVINDASPDKTLVEKLTELSSAGMFTLIENEKNRGFVQTVNRGMSLHEGRDVVLLNSDTEVYDGWLDRLVNASAVNDRAGTVTPLSNNATICSYPYFQHDNPFPLELDYRELDLMVSEVNKGIVVEAPTGVGFCMLIKRGCIEEVGLFDEKTFGKGYGEENDFCQRAISAGWLNLIATDVFVRHWGSVSFQGEKARLAGSALRKVEKKHPRYLSDVAEFIRREPLSETHRRIDWARLLRLRREKNVLLICHARGGGTEKRVQEDINHFAAKGYGVYQMRPVPGAPNLVSIGNPAARWLPNLAPVEWTDSHGLRDMVEALHITDVISHSFVDYVKEAPLHLKNLVEAEGLKWVMNLHDYEVVCPRINLFDENGYCNEPEADVCNSCLRTCGSSFDETDIRAWRTTHEAAMQAAARVVVPDQDVKERLFRYYPGIKVKVRPHERIVSEKITKKKIVLQANEKLRVVVMGAISKMKGFDVLHRCARDASSRGLPLKFSLMGYSMNDRLLEQAGVEVSGKYEDADALAKLDHLAPHIVLIPSICPETYSYTLSIGLTGGYPVMAFDIGAVARRMRASQDDALIVPMSLTGNAAAINEILLKVRNDALNVEKWNEGAAKKFAVGTMAYE